MRDRLGLINSFLGDASFRFKVKLSRGKSVASELFTSADKFGRIDQLIANKVVRFEHDDESLDKSRKKYLKDLLSLKKTLLQSEISGDRRKGLDKELHKETKQYAEMMHSELKDITKIIALCSEIIKNEHISVMYDVRRPIILFNEYQKALTDNLKNVAIDDNLTREIINYWQNILKTYEDVIDSTIKLCKEDQNIIRPGNLAEAISIRAEAKRRLSGKALSLKRQIQQLEHFFRKLREQELIKREGRIDVVNAKAMEQNLAKFNELFSQLSNFCYARINSSHTLILEAKLLQEQKLEELSELDKEITKIKEVLEEKGDKNSEAYRSYNSTSFDKSYGKAGIMLLDTYKDSIKNLERKDQAEIRRDINLNNYEIRELNLDKSKLYSELNASVEKIKKSNSIMDKFRNKLITYIVLGAVAANLAGPFVKVVAADDKDRVVIVGSAEQIKDVLNENKLNAINFSTITSSVLASEDVSAAINNLINFEFRPDFVLNPNDTTQIVEYQKNMDFVSNSIKDLYFDAIKKVKDEVRAKLEKEDFTKKEIDDLIINSAVFETSISNFMINAFSDIFGNSRKYTIVPNNMTLSEERAEAFFNIFIKSLNQVMKDVPELEKVILKFIDEIQSNKNNVVRGMGTNGKDQFVSLETINKRNEVIKETVAELNKYVEKTDSVTLSKFFSNPDFAKYSRFSGNKNMMLINYNQLLNSAQGEEEYVKVDMIRDLIRTTDIKLYPKIIKLMEPLRCAELTLEININVKIYGSAGKVIPIPMIPFVDTVKPQDNALVIPSTHSKKHVPLKLGNVNSKSKGFNPGIFKNIPKMRSNHPVNPRSRNNHRSYIKK